MSKCKNMTILLLCTMYLQYRTSPYTSTHTHLLIQYLIIKLLFLATYCVRDLLLDPSLGRSQRRAHFLSLVLETTYISHKLLTHHFNLLFYLFRCGVSSSFGITVPLDAISWTFPYASLWLGYWWQCTLQVCTK
jgi:hypothetical protein